MRIFLRYMAIQVMWIVPSAFAMSIAKGYGIDVILGVAAVFTVAAAGWHLLRLLLIALGLVPASVLDPYKGGNLSS